MADHGIVRDERILSGRWHLADTQIAVADIRDDYQDRDLTSIIPKHFKSLSLREIKAALDFTFPEIRPSAASLVFGSITVACVCGEEAYGVTTTDRLCVCCLCGRAWGVEIKLAAHHETI